MNAAKSCRIASLALAAGLIVVSIASAGTITLPGDVSVQKVDFERHIMGLMGRLGCNAGACHGSFQGKGGLYLSLFGYSAEKDYQAFTREGGGRRVNLVDPDQSLLLLKPTAQVPHGGGKRFEKDSWQYQLIRQWISDGARWNKGYGAIKSVRITPSEQRFDKIGDARQVKVEAEFDDGSKQDVTALCDFRVIDDYVAEVVPGGLVKGLRPGDTSVVASYRGNIVTARVLIPVTIGGDFRYPKGPENNYIDREVFAKLKKLNIVPSDLSTDGEFLRRIYIDAIGCLPEPDAVRAFLADTNPNKRLEKIEELLSHPLHAALWATKFSDITGNNTDLIEGPQQDRPKKSKMWHDWFRRRVADNVPYDEIVRGVLCATSRDGQTPEKWMEQQNALDEAAQKGFDAPYAERDTLDLFWRKQGNNFTLELLAEHTAAAFMGVRIECAQCHKHPFDRWTQTDYRQYANIFGQVKYGASPVARSVIDKANQERRKVITDALAAVDKEFADKKKEALEALDKELAKLLENKAEEQPREEKKEEGKRRDRKGDVKKDEPKKDAPRKDAAKKDEPVKDASKKDAVKKDEPKKDEEKRVEANSDADIEKAKQQIEQKKRDVIARLDQEREQRRRQVQQRLNQRQVGQVREVYADNQGIRRLNHPDTNQLIGAKTPGGPDIKLEGDAREALFDWLRRPDNPFFARSFVNRVWAHYTGVGLVEPVDSFSAANPPSNARLLDALAEDFVKHGYDLRHLERTILQSRVYQLSAVPNATNVHDRSNYSRAYVRRMMAEVVVDVLNGALDWTESFGNDAPSGSHAIEVAPSRVQTPNLAYVFRIFGRPTRAAACECERSPDPALPQTLYLMTDPVVMDKITRGRLKKLIDNKKSNEEIIEEMFLAALCRLPKENEKNQALEHVRAANNRQAGLTNVVWALINTREFILNH